MSDFVRVEIQGDKALEAALGLLGGKVARRVMRKSLNAGAREIVKDARSRVVRRTGQLRKSLGVKVKTYKSGTLAAIVGPRTGFKATIDGKPVNPTNYSHLVEFGTEHSAARPFLGPAFTSKAPAALAKIARKVRTELFKESTKLPKGRR